MKTQTGHMICILVLNFVVCLFTSYYRKFVNKVMFVDTYNRPTRVAGGTPNAGAGGRISTGSFPANSYHSSRRSSEDSLEEMGSIRDLRVRHRKMSYKSIVYRNYLELKYDF